MEKTQIKNEINSMIDAEIAKIENGDRNESNVAKMTYLKIVASSIIESLPRIGSSREKDEEIMRWRYACNEIKWLETLLMQGQTIAVQNRISEIKALEKSNPKQFADQLQELEILKLYRDVIKANYYKNIANYEEMMKERKQVESDGINVSDLKLSAKDIISNVKKLDDEAKMLFWEEYFKVAGEHIYSTEKAQAFSASMMGE